MGAATTRAHIVEAADQLFYRQGYEHTSFAAIAEAVHISRGNFYYHFKSKDDILGAVIAARLESRQRMLKQWEAEEADPAGRIRRFVEIVVTNRVDIQNYGCPVGTLTTELAKLGHPALGAAGGLFTLFRSWLREQFTQLGHREQADALAMHVLTFSQGVATLAHAFYDEDFIHREVQRMHDWLGAYSAGTEGAAPVVPEDCAQADA
ncbi:TetR/AcrR family transcriptional regulator [Streptosporangium carneum]|uniref:TetR family transcriptional regulator n=1 Tax=Streptosporangium carneum TaxID=47481 RepID=A0A9W6HZV5_9ACTN|nr:TetR/AcrR family transcriptional regulator [Streptosporangium carneum]GLK09123.1 TetR family transcriptional regulator [Streptosporangium carneum]